MELTVIVPTRDRRAIVLETLDRLDRQVGGVGFEVIVTDDGSTDGTAEAVLDGASNRPYDLTLLSQPSSGASAARNRALDESSAPVCLFLNDDAWPREDLIARHRDFHARRPEETAAVLGHVQVAADPPPTPFMLWWLGNPHFDFAGIEDPEDAGGERFFTANVSAKTAFLRAAGAFDEDQGQWHEDIDLGLRLEARGMKLAYDRQAVVDHYHPLDLPTTLEQLRDIGRSAAAFAARHPGREWPRRPGIRHRVKAAALTGLALARVRSDRVQRETWRFLCHEAHREAYWSATDGVPAGPLRIGRTLARLAARDEDARMPAGAP